MSNPSELSALTDSDTSPEEKEGEAQRESSRPGPRVLELADICFEMFSTRELRRGNTVIADVKSDFPDLSMEELNTAIGLALNWKRTLRASGRRLH